MNITDGAINYAFRGDSFGRKTSENINLANKHNVASLLNGIFTALRELEEKRIKQKHRLIRKTNKKKIKSNPSLINMIYKSC